LRDFKRGKSGTKVAAEIGAKTTSLGAMATFLQQSSAQLNFREPERIVLEDEVNMRETNDNTR